jgi:hypothetical protein
MPGMAGRTFKLKYEIPDMEISLENERKVILSMTRAVWKLVVRRTARGLDSSGRPFAAPEDGGIPLEETGQLKRSIGYKVVLKGGPSKSKRKRKTTKKTRMRWAGVVRAMGRREMTTEERKGRRSRAKEKTLKMRELASADFARGVVRKDLGARVSTKTGKLSVGRVKVHAITDNAHLAAVLSTEPKRGDKAKNRANYRIFEVSTKEIEEATGIMRDEGRFRLVKIPGRKRRSRR